MSIRFFACTFALLAAAPAGAHRLDEYLQATLITVEKDRVRAELRLAPGVAVLPAALVEIDRDADGTISASEQRAYAERVLGDLSLAVDGKRLPLNLTASKFPSRELLEEGLGEIRLRFEADVPGGTAKRRLIFENHHRSAIGVYLVNALLPRDPDIQLGSEQRSDDQSFYGLEYADAGAVPASFPWGWIAGVLALMLGLQSKTPLRRRGVRGEC